MTELISVQETCRRLGVSDDTVYRLMKRRELRSLKLGRSRRVVLADVEALVERQLLAERVRAAQPTASR